MNIARKTHEPTLTRNHIDKFIKLKTIQLAKKSSFFNTH